MLHGKAVTKTEKIRVLIDIDGVLRDFIGGLNHVYLREYPTHKIKPVTSEKLENFYPIGEKIYEFIDKLFLREILEDAPAYPGAIEALWQREEEFEIVIATTQPDQARCPTLAWLGKNDVPTNEIHIMKDKQRLDGIGLLDDFPENLENFAATGRLAVCMDRPWNQHWIGPRVKSVDEFFEMVLRSMGKSNYDDEILLA